MSKQTNAPKFVIALAVASIYFATAYLSLFLATINNSASPFWPATGIAVAAVYVYGVSGFIGVLVGAFAGNLTTGAPIMAVVLIGVGNALESFVGSAILKYLLLNRWRASTYIRMAAVPVAGLFASAISPTMGGLALVGFGDVPWTEFSKTWITWFGGDLVGFLAVVPSLIFRDLFPDPREYNEHKSIPLGGLVTLISFGLCGLAAFGRQEGYGAVFVMFMPLLVAAAALPARWTLVVNVVSTIVMVTLSYLNRGVFAGLATNDALVGLQFFLGAMAMTAVTLEYSEIRRELKNVALVYLAFWIGGGAVFFAFHRSQEKNGKEAVQQLMAVIKSRLDHHAENLGDKLAVIESKVQMRIGDPWFSREVSDAIIEMIPRDGLDGILFIGQGIADVPEGQPDTMADQLILDPMNLLPKAELIGNIKAAALEHIGEAGKVTLIAPPAAGAQVGEERPFLVLKPVYQFGNGKSSDAAEDGRRVGTLVGIINPNDFLGHYAPSFETGPCYSIYLIDQRGRKVPLFGVGSGKQSGPLNSTQSSLESGQIVEKLGLRFYIEWTALPKYAAPNYLLLAWTGLLCGLMAVLFGILRAAALSYRRFAEVEIATKTLDLVESRAILQTILDSVPIGIFRTTSGGEISFANKAWAAMGGPSMPGQDISNWHDKVLADDRSTVMVALRAAKEGISPASCRYRAAVGDDDIRYIYGIIAPIKDVVSGKVDLIGVAIDETTEHHLTEVVEEQRKNSVQAAKMVSLGAMAGDIAHEISNPLTIMKLSAEAVQAEIAKELLNKEKVAQNAERIIRSCRRVTQIIKGVRVFSRNADADPMSVCSVAEILNDAVSLCEAKIHAADALVSLNLPDQEIAISCRPTQICQVIVNFLSNAIDAVEAEPRRAIQIGCAETATHVQLSVEDSGPGVPTSIREKVMTPFFTTKPVGKGTGLGLSISQTIASSHGGRIFLDPDARQTRFVLELPKVM